MPETGLPDSSYIYNPAAYGTIPDIPPTSTNTQTNVSGWTTGLPNYAQLAELQSGNISNQLRGMLNPQDLANAQTWAAQRGIGTGVGFQSPNNLAAYQQFLGLSAQQLEQQGQQNLNAALAAAPRTTTTTGTQTIDNNVLREIYAHAPDPYAAALANLAAQGLGLRSGGAAGTVAPRPVTPAGGTTTPGGTPFPTPVGDQPSGGWSGPGVTPPITGAGLQGWSPLAPSGQWQTGGYGASGQSTVGGQNIPTGSSGVVTDSSGNQWIDVGSGLWVNPLTGEISEGSPPTDENWSYATPGGSSLTWGGTLPNDLFSELSTPDVTGYPSDTYYNPQTDTSNYGFDWYGTTPASQYPDIFNTNVPASEDWSNPAYYDDQFYEDWASMDPSVGYDWGDY